MNLDRWRLAGWFHPLAFRNTLSAMGMGAMGDDHSAFPHIAHSPCPVYGEFPPAAARELVP